MELNYRYLTMVKFDKSSKFEYIEDLKPKELRKYPFIIVVDHLKEFSLHSNRYINKIIGIIINPNLSIDKSVFLGDSLYLLGGEGVSLNESVFLAENILTLLVTIKNKYKENKKLNYEVDKLTTDISKTSTYTDVVDRVMRDMFEKETKWMVKALTKVVHFVVQKLEPLTISQFPEAITNFLYQPFFGYRFAAIYNYNQFLKKWSVVSQKGDENFLSIPDIIPQENSNWEVDGVLYQFFRSSDDLFLLTISKKDCENRFSKYESSFFSTLSTLIASFYHLKKLTLQLEEKIIEIKKFRSSDEIVDMIKYQKISLQEGIKSLIEALNIEEMFFTSNFKTISSSIISRDIFNGIYNWDHFLKMIVNEKDSWDFFEIVDPKKDKYGVLACKIKKNDPFYNLQTRVIKSTLSQIAIILSGQKLHYATITDPLTKIYNRRYFDIIVKRKITEVVNGDGKLSLLMLDIDFFKLVNDNYGHLAGDRVLQLFGMVLKKILREGDLPFRYGGEEFAVLLNCPSDIAVKVGERIRNKISKEVVHFQDKDISITVSIGVSDYKIGLNIEDFIEKADEALYQAKKTGRDKVVYFG